MDIHNSAHVTALLNALLLIAVCIAALVAIPLRRMLFHAGWHTPTSMHEFFIIVSYALLVTLACAIGTAAGALMVCNALQSGEALNGKTSLHYVSIDANSTLFLEPGHFRLPVWIGFFLRRCGYISASCEETHRLYLQRIGAQPVTANRNLLVGVVGKPFSFAGRVPARLESKFNYRLRSEHLAAS